MTQITGMNSFGTGDINLAAAILTMGVRPCPVDPVKLIACENGKDYVRFHVGSVSDDGCFFTDLLMSAWDDPAGFKRQNPGHPFSDIMDFISERPRDCRNRGQWMEHAANFLGLPIDAVVSTLRNIGKTCAASPESTVSYVVAFIQNRFDLVSAAKTAAAQGRVTHMLSHGQSIGMIPANMPAPIRGKLLSHIN